MSHRLWRINQTEGFQVLLRPWWHRQFEDELGLAQVVAKQLGKRCRAPVGRLLEGALLQVLREQSRGQFFGVAQAVSRWVVDVLEQMATVWCVTEPE